MLKTLTNYGTEEHQVWYYMDRDWEDGAGMPPLTSPHRPPELLMWSVRTRQGYTTDHQLIQS